MGNTPLPPPNQRPKPKQPPKKRGDSSKEDIFFDPRLEVKSNFVVIMVKYGHSLGIRLSNIVGVEYPSDPKYVCYDVTIHLNTGLDHLFDFVDFDVAHEFGTELLLAANDGVTKLPTFDATDIKRDEY